MAVTSARVMRIQGDLLDALYTFSRKPVHDMAYRALQHKPIADTAIALAEEMRRMAIEEDRDRSRKRAALINYRRFYVGGVGIGLVPAKRSYRRFDWFCFPAHNTKWAPKAEKFCAEMRIMRAARESSCQCIGGLVVIGERQADGRSGVIRPIGLDPCEACRDCMRKPENRKMISGKTLILTGQPLSQVHSIETIPKMMAAHEESWQ